MEIKKLLIGSPIHQKPEILKEFLASLTTLKQDKLQVHFCFFDDNNEEATQTLLRNFAAKEKNTTIFHSQQMGTYQKDGYAHYWNDSLVWKVAP
jgi:hypothetical protein